MSEDVVSIDCNKDFSWFCNSQFWCSLRNKQSIIIIIMIIIILINNYNYSPKSRWLVVDIIRVTIFQVSPKFYHGYEIKTTNLNATFWGIRKTGMDALKPKERNTQQRGELSVLIYASYIRVSGLSNSTLLVLWFRNSKKNTGI